MIDLKIKEPTKTKTARGEICKDCPENKEVIDWYLEVSGDHTEIKEKISRVRPKRHRRYLERRVKFLD